MSTLNLLKSLNFDILEYYYLGYFNIILAKTGRVVTSNVVSWIMTSWHTGALQLVTVAGFSDPPTQRRR